MPTETGIYTAEDVECGHLFSPRLCKAITNIFKTDIPIIDLGCGLGTYVDEYNTLGYKAIGVDGISVSTHSNNIFIHDLTKPLDLNLKGNVICLEVGEHIPAEFESILLNNIFNHCSQYIVLSWAVENQIGIGHINCKNNDYVINKFIQNNFIYEEQLTQYLRSDIEDCCNYFRSTLMVFRKNG